MKTLQYIPLYFKLVSAGVRAQLQYRFAFIMRIIGLITRLHRHGRSFLGFLHYFLFEATLVSNNFSDFKHAISLGLKFENPIDDQEDLQNHRISKK